MEIEIPETESDEELLLVIEHKHGADSGIYESEEEILDTLHDWVKTWWPEEGTGKRSWYRAIPQEMPGDPEERVEVYFSAHDKESFYVVPTGKVVA